MDISGFDAKSGQAGPEWAGVDREWYAGQYGEFPDFDVSAGPKSFYAAIAAQDRRSPNPYFNEAWYLAKFSDVAEQIKTGLFASGFEHYRKIGHSSRPPHWLFMESLYRMSNRDVTQSVLDERGFLNGYGHFLGCGDREKRTGSLFFDPRMYLANFAACGEAVIHSPFTHFARNGFRNPQHRRLSWYFDPSWYVRTYPAVGEAVESGLYACALEHYLCNTAPQEFDPSPFFSERFYLSQHRDIAGAIAAGRFRNGYDHFTQHGVFERRKPHPHVDLESYFKPVAVQADIEIGKFRDAFAHFTAAAELIKPRPAPAISEDQSKQLFFLQARNLATTLARHGLDFSVIGEPKLSVIMLMQDKIEHNLQALEALHKAVPPGSVDLILVDTGSYDDTRHIGKFVQGARSIRFAWPAGFAEAANAAIDLAAAPAILFLSRDGVMTGNAVQLALERLFSAADIGAVGAKIIQSNGLLQEGGSIIWQDGSICCYLRGRDPNLPEANFVRETDFVSAAFMLVKTALLKQAGGFDPAFMAAVYAEADLCVRLAAMGYRIIYDPSVMLIKSAGQTTAPPVDVLAHSLARFQSVHADFLARQSRRWADGEASARHARSDRRPRILFIEDRLPFRQLGAGYTRANDIIRAMVRLNYQVTVFPVYQAVESSLRIYHEFPDQVEIILDRELPDLPAFLADRPDYYDIFWVGRTQNAARVLDVLKAAGMAMPGKHSVLDTEAVAAMRNQLRDQLRNRPVHADSLPAQIVSELKHARNFETIIAVSQLEADAIAEAGLHNVKLLGHVQTVRPGMRPFNERHGLLFVGALHDRDSPNLDSLNWFVTKILPKLAASLPDHLRFTIAGYVNNRIDLANIARIKGIDLLGPQDDLSPLYDRHRVFIAPTRFAAGIPYKLHEAAAHGIPIVASTLLARQMAWTPGQELLAADPADPDHFAAEIGRLYNDETLWTQLRAQMLDRVASEAGMEDYDARLNGILTNLPNGAND